MKAKYVICLHLSSVYSSADCRGMDPHNTGSTSGTTCLRRKHRMKLLFKLKYSYSTVLSILIVESLYLPCMDPLKDTKSWLEFDHLVTLGIHTLLHQNCPLRVHHFHLKLRWKQEIKFLMTDPKRTLTVHGCFRCTTSIFVNTEMMSLLYCQLLVKYICCVKHTFCLCRERCLFVCLFV